MNSQIEQSIDRLTNGARSSVQSLIHTARNRGEQAAGRVRNGKKPLSTLSGLGLKLSAVSHRTTDRVLKQNTALAANQLDAIADRFNSAANASCLRDLVKKQLSMTPQQFARFGSDAKDALAIVVDGGVEARNVIRASISDFSRPAKAKKAPARKKATRRKAAKKVAKKVAPKKTVVRKKARKVSAKPANAAKS